MSNYIFFEDAGHGWLKVSKDELKDLGILEQISKYSYVFKDSVYLEEDYDMNLFVGTKQKQTGKIIKYKTVYSATSGIRNFPRFEAVQQ